MTRLADQLDQLLAFTTAAKDQCVESGETGSADLLLAAGDLVGRARTRLPEFDEDELARQAQARLAEDEETVA